MTINNGRIELYVAAGQGRPGGVTATINYSPVLTNGVVVPANQPIVNVNGSAMTVVNTTGLPTTVQVSGPAGPLLGGDGQASVVVPVGGLAFTANQLRNAAGIETRGDVAGFSLQSP